MPFLTLGEAVDRVLQRLSDQRNEKAGGIDAPRKVAPADWEENRARSGKRGRVSRHHQSHPSRAEQ